MASVCYRRRRPPRSVGEATLFERSPQGFLVRVQTDNTDQPFDINDLRELELGSTAKLRVLTTYLQMVTELHQRFCAALDSRALRQQVVDPQDNSPAAGLSTIWLAAAIAPSPPCCRPPSIAAIQPALMKATGGGLHTFANFLQRG